MGAIERYNARVGMQEDLDQYFPRGAWITVLEDWGKLVPTGVELTTGRVFCSDAREAEGGWEFQLFIDPRVEGQDFAQVDQPYTCWIGQIDSERDPLFEAEIIDDDEPPFEIIRLRSDPAGPRRVKRGQRAFITELREAELFPRGLEVADADIAG